jgi:hypothetical protein
MTLKKKAALCTGEGPTTTPVERLGIPGYMSMVLTASVTPGHQAIGGKAIRLPAFRPLRLAAS